MQLDKKVSKISRSHDLPKRMPNFLLPYFLNNFAFSLEPTSEHYEYFNGRFYKRIEVLKSGKSFGE